MPTPVFLCLDVARGIKDVSPLIWLFTRNTLLCLLGAALLSGCATRSLFQPYPDQARQWKSGLAAGAPPPSVLDKGALCFVTTRHNARTPDAR